LAARSSPLEGLPGGLSAFWTLDAPPRTTGLQRRAPRMRSSRPGADPMGYAAGMRPYPSTIPTNRARPARSPSGARSGWTASQGANQVGPRRGAAGSMTPRSAA